MSNILKFQTNVFEEIAYRGSFEEAQSQFKDEPDYRLSLVSGQMVYLPRIAKRRIEELGIQEGELFQIGRIEKRVGQKKQQVWEVKRVYPAEAVAPAPAEVTPARENVTSTVQNNNGLQHHAASNGRPAPAQTGDLLDRSFDRALDGLQRIQQRAAQAGTQYKFTERDLISVALSLYINGAKGGVL